MVTDYHKDFHLGKRVLISFRTWKSKKNFLIRLPSENLQGDFCFYPTIHLFKRVFQVEIMIGSWYY